MSTHDHGTTSYCKSCTAGQDLGSQPGVQAGYRMPVSTPPMDPSMMLLAGMAAPGMGATSVDPMDPNAHLRGLLLSQGQLELLCHDLAGTDSE